MLINTLCIGDVVGDPGVAIVSRVLPTLIDKYQLEFVVCNAENAAGGSGITPRIYKDLIESGVDVITLGDHAFRKKQSHKILEESKNIIRPENIQRSSAGKGWTVVDSKNGHAIAVISIIGQLNISSMHGDSPWTTATRIIGDVKKQTKIVILDFHGEATSEKIGMGWHCNGKTSIVFGTHTHVPTADTSILSEGTAFISDVGMTGPYNSILGRMKDRVLKHLTTSMPHKFDVANGDSRLYGLLTSIDTHSGKAVSTKLLRADDQCNVQEYPQATASQPM